MYNRIGINRWFPLDVSWGEKPFEKVNRLAAYWITRWLGRTDLLVSGETRSFLDCSSGHGGGDLCPLCGI